VCTFIEEALDAAAATGKGKPTEIRLGRRQLEAFRECHSAHISCHASPGPRESYDDIQITEVNESSHRSIVFNDGQELLLD
jgi:hypothetical protein